MPILSRRRLRAKRSDNISFAGSLKSGLSLKGLIRSTPRYFINSSNDVNIKRYQNNLTTKTGLPAIRAYGVANFTATDEPPTPHRMIIVGLQKEIAIANQRKVLVSCDCGNYKFVWEYANTVNKASRIKYSNGQPAYYTNPSNRPGLCKHLIALSYYILDEGD